MSKCLLILDYNNTRFKDVLKMRIDVKKRYGYQLCLIRPNPSAVDLEIADFVIDLNFSDPNFLTLALEKINQSNLEIVGGFPFSDKAVHSGTQLLSHLGLQSDSEKLAIAAISKWEYRQAEKNHNVLFNEQNIFIPRSAIVNSFEEFREMFMRSPGGVVLKPTNEGNNRGVTIVQNESAMFEAWRDASPWMHQGLIVEEIIPFSPEYSHDGVAHLDFVTKKFSTQGRYPVENGQEVSAELDRKVLSRIKQTGRLVNNLTGSRVGAFHNEIKFDVNQLRTSVVEPNRRPAGMHIWDLAEKVYGISFYSLLIDSILGFDLPEQLPAPQGAAAIRMLPAARDGVLLNENIQNVFGREIERLSKQIHVEFFNFTLLKKAGEQVMQVPKTNADFVAQICCYAQSSAQVQIALDELAMIWRQTVQIYISVEKAS